MYYSPKESSLKERPEGSHWFRVLSFTLSYELGFCEGEKMYPANCPDGWMGGWVDGVFTSENF